jgi:hypothetical protein
MRGRSTEPHWTDRHHYDCPYCEKGEAVFFGIDTRKELVFECDNCTRKLGEVALKLAARELSGELYNAPGLGTFDRASTLHLDDHLSPTARPGWGSDS